MSDINEQQFVAKREPDWILFNKLNAKASISPKQLSQSELKEYLRLYKRISTDLATIRTRSTNAQLAQFLNDMLASAYGTVYRPRRKPLTEAIGAAVALAAQTMRKRAGAVATSAGVFVGAAILANLVLRAVPESKASFVSPQWQDVVEHWRDNDMEERDFGDSMTMSGFYASNNPRASIMTGALAAGTFGILTTKLLYDNGALLGALAFELEPVGRVGYLLVHILPHGVPELSGIVIAGAAGYVMALALIAPGRRTRGEALGEAGKDAIVLLATSVVMMFIAAPIEGFFSFNPRVPDWARLIVIVVSALAWAAFWYGYGRNEEEGKEVFPGGLSLTK